MPSTKVAILFFAQGFGSGRAPWAPGTIGTLPGVVLYWTLADLPLVGYLVLSVLLFLVGVSLCGRAAHALGQTDPPSVVWDEMVGYLVTMTGIPPSGLGMLAGFALFRLFDIWKPWPIGFIDRRVQGGLGIMLDDLVAGLFGLALLHLLMELGMEL
jgi:phosphatidylglycerophosphatase A